MTKEQILNEWQPGDDSEAVRILKHQHAVEVSRNAIAAWRKRANNRSPLTPFYIAAFKAAIQQRKSNKP